MAKITEQLVVIRLSKLTRNTEEASFTLPDDFAANLEALVAEMVESNVIVEVAVDND